MKVVWPESTLPAPVLQLIKQQQELEVNMQTPAQGIMLDRDHGNAKSYTIACDCHDTDHQVHMWIELNGDKDVKDVELTFYVNTTTPFWKPGFSRVKAAWDILVNGYREDQHSLILNQQAALNVANTITTVIKELKEK
jgi:hypothetical protein